MKKLLISILIALLVALSIFIGWNGLTLGKVQILGVQGIQQKNDELDTEVEKATRLASVDYKKAIADVEENAKQMNQKKQDYEEMTMLNADENGQVATQIQRYEIETLWVKLGNYATSEGATIKIDLTKGTNTVEDTYNLNFTVNGSYISITDFISDIENDTTLGFKIENFKMYPNQNDGNTLQATFTCKDISIMDVDTTAVVTPTTTDTNTNNTTNSTNTTNSVNATSSNNTTNTTNTTNSTN